MQLVAQQEHIRDIAALANLDEQLQVFAKTDWQALRQQNPQGANAGWQRMLQLTQARNAVAAKLAQRMEAKYAADGQRQLRREIKGWNPDIARRLRDYGVSLGFEPDELAAINDPRVVKALHRAWLGEQGGAANAAPTPERDIRPLSQVARRSSPATAGLSDGMSTADWIKTRNKQLRQRKG